MTEAFADVLARARAGDPAAREGVARRAYAPVRRLLAARFPRQPPDALDDLTQEAMARIARRLPDCRADTEPRFFAWAYRAALSAALNYLAAPGAARTTADARFVLLDARDAPSTLATTLADADALAEVLASADAPVPGPSDGAGGALARLAVEAYRELPDAAQTLLWRRLVERADWADLGRELGTTGAAVKRRFERACARLARAVNARRGGNHPPAT